MEAGLHGATRTRFGCLARPAGSAALPKAVQSPHGPIRDRRLRLHRLCALANRSHFPHGASTGICGTVAIELQGVSTATKARKLLARPGHGSAGVNERRQLSSEGRSAMVVPTATVGRKPACVRLLPISIRQPHWHRHLDVKRPNRPTGFLAADIHGLETRNAVASIDS